MARTPVSRRFLRAEESESVHPCRDPRAPENGRAVKVGKTQPFDAAALGHQGCGLAVADNAKIQIVVHECLPEALPHARFHIRIPALGLRFCHAMGYSSMPNDLSGIPAGRHTGAAYEVYSDFQPPSHHGESQGRQITGKPQRRRSGWKQARKSTGSAGRGCMRRMRPYGGS